MLTIYGSCWLFHSCNVFHLRYAIGGQNNQLQRFSGRPNDNRRKFHPNIKHLVSDYLFDPDVYIENFSLYRGVCIPVSICLTILVGIEKKPPSHITKKDVSQILPCLNFHHLVEHKKCEPPSIPLKNFKNLEKANSPIPLKLSKLIPGLSTFRGIALNLFRIQCGDSENDKTIHIYPKLLSPKHDSNEYLQVDLIEDGPHLWANSQINPLHNPKTLHSSPAHVLVVPDFIKFLYTNNLQYQHNGARDCHFCCRICQSLFKSAVSFKSHKIACNPFPSGHKTSKRKIRNRIISHHLSQNPYTGKTEVSGLRFRRGELHKLLLPLTLTACDVESFLHTPKPEQPTPSGAEKIHSVFAYALAHTSLHDHLHLPSNLSKPRGMCYDPETQSEDDFMLSFLLTLRQDAKMLSLFLAESFERDPGIPIKSNFSPEENFHWNLHKRCIFCGNLFFSHKFKRSDTPIRAVSTFRKPFSIIRTKEKVLPARDHVHLQLKSKLQA